LINSKNICLHSTKLKEYNYQMSFPMYKQKKNQKQKRRKNTGKEKIKTKKTHQPMFNQCNHLRRATWEVSLAGGV